HGGDSIPVRDSAVATQLYRIAQEAVANAAKHAAAENIDIRVTVNGSELALAITDNGVGIPDKLPDSKGLGLRLMRHGAALIGATLSVQRHGGDGTAAVFKVRIPKQSESNISIFNRALPSLKCLNTGFVLLMITRWSVKGLPTLSMGKPISWSAGKRKIRPALLLVLPKRGQMLRLSIFP